MSTFKRGEYLILHHIGAESLEGSVVKFVRKSRRTDSITVEFVNKVGAYNPGDTLNVHNYQLIKSARRAGKMQGARQRLIMCYGCNYRLRGSDSALNSIGIPNCPGCGKPMERVYGQDETQY